MRLVTGTAWSTKPAACGFGATTNRLEGKRAFLTVLVGVALWGGPAVWGAPQVGGGFLAPGLPLTFQESGAGEWTARGGSVQARINASGLQLWDGSHSMGVTYEGRGAGVRVEGGAVASGTVNLLLGRSPDGWRTNVAAYDSLWMRGLYPGIDLHLSGARGWLKSEYVVAPGADPQRIRIRYAPAYRVMVDAGGALRIETETGVWQEAAPLIYQVMGGRVRTVGGRYVVRADGTAGFEVDEYDRGRPLVIDPVVTFSSLVGGSGASAATGVAVDAAGYVYLAGYTDAANLPVQSPVAGRASGVDAYVAKIQPSTGRLIYATYIGGTGDDRAFSVAVDATGAAYVTGWTTSTNFPVASAAQAAISGYKDAFVLKLNPAGSAFVFSTYFGGTGSEAGNAVALTATMLWIGGDSSSASLPSGNGWRNTNGGMQDGFLARYSQTGTLLGSTMLGGGGDDSVKAVVVDGQGNVFAGGATGSSNMNFPLGGLQTSLKGSQDGFVVKFDATAVQMVAGTYLGGTRGDVSNPEMVLGLAVDTVGNVYATGMTPSSDFPLVAAWSGTLSGLQDAYVARLVNGLNALTWSTLVGGSGKESGTCIGVDASGVVVVGGSTTSSNFPVVGGTQTATGGGSDGFVLRMSADGTSVPFSTYAGGSAADGVAALALGPAGTIHVAGQSGSGDYPRKNPAQAVTGSALRLFATRIAVGVLPTLVSVSPNAGAGSLQAFTFSATHPSGAAQIGTLELMVGPAAGSAQVCRIRYDRSTGLLGLATDTGLTWTTVAVGSGAAVGNSQCTLTGSGATVVSSGNTLTVTATVSFAAGFAGAWQTYLNGSAVSGEETGFAPAGMWTAVAMTNQAPTASLVTPSSGTGASGQFSVVFSDANGGADITTGRVIVHTSATDVNSCSVRVQRATGLIELAADAGSSWTSGAAGSPGTLQNSQCQVKLAGSTITVSGSTLTVLLDMVFQPAFVGGRTVYGMATDAGGASSTWKQLGSWTVPGAVANVAPVAASVSPASGSGSAQVLTFTYTDANGATDIAVARVLVNAQQTASAGCYFEVDRAAGVVWLADDSGNVWASSAHLGTSDVASNSQCSVHGEGSSIAVNGVTLTLTVNVSFQAAFNGAKSVYANATDSSGLTSTSPQLGAYTVVAANLQPTGPVSVSPASGSGSSQIFTFVFADPRGAADLTWLRVLVHAQQTAVSGCYVEVDPVALVAYLYDDAGAGYTAARLDSSDTVQNSQCKISGTGSSVALTGTQATLLLNVTFQPAFAGMKSVWANASDRAGFTSASPQLGTYSVALPAGQALGAVSVSPASGSGASQVFSFVFADPKGSNDLAWMRVLIHGQQVAADGCYIAVERSTSIIYLADDAGVNWTQARMGTSDVATNSQCSVSGAPSSMTLSGTSATVVLGISFTAAFNGGRKIWANATDSTGATSSSPQIGTYTVAATGGNQAPLPVSVTPASGSGSRQVFTFIYSDGNGGTDIETPRMLIHSAQTAEHSCYFLLTRSTGRLSLADDAGVNWTQARLSANETVQNSQCVLYGATSSMSTAGNSLAVSVDVGFKADFTGARNVWANATDLAGLTSASPLLGLYTVTP
ncbi:SBBP repeat-containing protein [uncultured Paludibaculum sp.]|uniref:beta strand repeat-containing protein n=1 Tax=uncultured Paludibaculum sp. TaxID=1765020 RepID=UPI002AAB38FF|nr:SBBP repeat-containing protein [uncultured Paludibaculum sp.]